ncbi:hypothetical protein PG2006B_1389 [Bifidobacterium animalis subsp. animalis]|nr:hypothetical protein PG2006B_1389 [Bifidobacterium animalis subsp. animalis]
MTTLCASARVRHMEGHGDETNKIIFARMYRIRGVPQTANAYLRTRVQRIHDE